LTESDYQTCIIDNLSALEEALTKPLLSQWATLIESDPSATLFQSPVWCMPWYRTYSQFDPRVIIASSGSRLCGVVPLAAEKQTGRLTFAGDNIADYKDVVSVPEFRERLLVTLLRYIRSAGSGHTVYFGSTQPASESPAILSKIAGKCGIRVIQRMNSGWRWWPEEQTEDPLKKKSVRYPINYFKRHGELCAQHIRTVEEWDDFKDEFYRQHTLRQIYGGRPVADSPERRTFFDALVRTPCAHVTALRLNRDLIAGHIGFVHKKVLYWGAPAFDIRYNQYSPNLVLLVLTMKNAEAWDLAGIDLTVGKGDLKERFSTSRVDAPFIEIYPRLTSFYSRALRIFASQAVKRGEGTQGWKRAKPHIDRLTARLWRSEPADLSTPVHLITLKATPDSLQAVEPRLESGEQVEFHKNQIYDLLQRTIMADDAGRQITRAARIYADEIKQGKSFHTVLINNRLAAWGYSRRDEPNQVILEGFYTLPEFRGRHLAGALAVHIAQLYFRDGVAQAITSIPQRAEAARKAVTGAGFIHA
jgi:CelD/BcsL family acetyltransferase involved in cellulose biosynthesis